MAHRVNELLDRKSLMINLTLTGAVFVFFVFILRPFVPWRDPSVEIMGTQLVVWLGAIYTSASISGVFFIASCMFAFVARDQALGKNSD